MDVFGQALRALLGRSTRSMLTAAGIGLGVAATVATVGISASAGGAIADRFDAARATLVTARYNDPAAHPEATTVDRLRKVNGVVAAGLVCAGEPDASLTSVSDAVAQTAGTPVSVQAAQHAALRALGVTLIDGRWFDDGHDLRGDRVAMLDVTAARAVGVSDVSQSPLVYLDGDPYAVLGIFRPPPGAAQLTNAIVLPYRACRDGWTTFTGCAVVARTELGAADQVGVAAPVALDPNQPQAVTMLVPADLRSFRRGVERDTRALFLGLAAVSLLIGALGVSNTTLVSVLERRSEIGLRRAVGASRSVIASQFMVESALLGVAGGVGGAVIGVDVASVVCLVKGWLLVQDLTLLMASPGLGLVVGMLAGAYPAYSAARVVPAATLRG